MRKLAGIFLCGAVLGAAGYLMLNDLTVKPLELYDEGTYAQVVKESMERSDFLTFTYDGEAFFDKPPLYFWLASMATTLTEDPVWGIRLPAALAGVGVVAAVMLLAYTWSRSFWTAAVAGLALILIPPYIVAAREARLDVLISLFILLSIYTVACQRWALFGVALGLAVLSKSAIAVFALPAALPYLRTKGFWQGIAVALAVSLPWHLYEWARHGWDFWLSYLGTHVFERFSTNLFHDPALQTDYWARLIEQTPLVLALFLLMLVAAVALWPDLSREKRYTLALPFVIGALMAVIFFSSQTRAMSYLVPIYPLVALFVALVGSYAVQYRRAKLGHELSQNDRRTS